MFDLETYKRYSQVQEWVRQLDNPGFATDTPTGLLLKIRPHNRNFIAGHNQQELRSDLGICIDPDTNNEIILKGMTVAALQDLREQVEQEKRDVKKTEEEEAEGQFRNLLEEVNKAEESLAHLGVELTTADDLGDPYEGTTPEHCHSDRVNAIPALTDWLEKLRVVELVKGSMETIFHELTGEEIVLGVERINSDSGWSIRYSRESLEALANDLSLADKTELKVEALYRWLNEHPDQGIRLEEDEAGYVTYATNEQGQAKLSSYLFFQFHEDSCPVQRIQWGDDWYDFSSVDALLLMRKLAGRTEEGLTLRLPEEESKTLGESLGFHW